MLDSKFDPFLQPKTVFQYFYAAYEEIDNNVFLTAKISMFWLLSRKSIVFVPNISLIICLKILKYCFWLQKGVKTWIRNRIWICDPCFVYSYIYDFCMKVNRTRQSWRKGNIDTYLLISCFKIPKIPFLVTKRGQNVNLISDLDPRPKDCV